jgi:hypothetical protein
MIVTNICKMTDQFKWMIIGFRDSDRPENYEWTTIKGAILSHQTDEDPEVIRQINRLKQLWVDKGGAGFERPSDAECWRLDVDCPHYERVKAQIIYDLRMDHAKRVVQLMDRQQRARQVIHELRQQVTVVNNSSIPKRRASLPRKCKKKVNM